jgi:hypothetical protein
MLEPPYNWIVPLAVLALVLIPFFAIVAAMLWWRFAGAPKGATRAFGSLLRLGYREIPKDDPETLSLLAELAPFSMEGSTLPSYEDGDRSILNAAVFDSRPPHYVVNVVQQLTDGAGDVTPIWQTLAFGRRSFDLSEVVFIRSRKGDNPYAAARSARFGLREMPADRLKREFCADFSVWTPEGRTIEVPESIQEAFLAVRNHLVQPDLVADALFKKDLLWQVNSRFAPNGWAICSSNVWLDSDKLAALVNVARILCKA